MRQIALDTETTGLNHQHDQIVEVGAVEIVNRRIGESFHSFCRPTVSIHPGAEDVHGLTEEFLADKPPFESIRQPLLDFLSGADEILIHNAPFDVRFLENEIPDFETRFNVTCTLKMARELRPGKKSGLDVLASFYEVVNDRAKEGRHGALIDAEILAQVYLHMSTGQSVLAMTPERSLPGPRPLALPERRQAIVYLANDEERKLHAEFCKSVGIPVF